MINSLLHERFIRFAIAPVLYDLVLLAFGELIPENPENLPHRLLCPIAGQILISASLKIERSPFQIHILPNRGEGLRSFTVE